VIYIKLNYAVALINFGMVDEAIKYLVDCDKILKIKGKTLKTS